MIEIVPSSESKDGLGPAPADGMRWVPGATFSMGSEDFYPEERPVHQVGVDGFWIDESPVTAAEFRRFVRDTKYVTVAERPLDPRDTGGVRSGRRARDAAPARRHREGYGDPARGISVVVDDAHGGGDRNRGPRDRGLAIAGGLLDAAEPRRLEGLSVVVSARPRAADRREGRDGRDGDAHARSPRRHRFSFPSRTDIPCSNTMSTGIPAPASRSRSPWSVASIEPISAR